MTLIDGKAISEQVKQEIAAEVAEIVAKGGKRPHLAAILVGHDGGSETYVAAKVKACEVCGFKSSLIRYEADVTEEELLAKVRELNEDADVDGFIVQLPLPKHISEQKVIETIDYRKDVDGFHPGSFQLVNVFYFPSSVFSGFKAIADYHGEGTILDVAFCHHPLAVVVKPSLGFREVDMEFGHLIRVFHFPFYSFGRRVFCFKGTHDVFGWSVAAVFAATKGKRGGEQD